MCDYKVLGLEVLLPGAPGPWAPGVFHLHHLHLGGLISPHMCPFNTGCALKTSENIWLLASSGRPRAQSLQPTGERQPRPGRDTGQAGLPAPRPGHRATPQGGRGGSQGCRRAAKAGRASPCHLPARTRTVSVG